jgi:hypothetical protein
MAPPPVTPVPLLNYPDPFVSDYRLGHRHQLQRQSCEVVSKWNAARGDVIADAVSDAVHREKGNLQFGCIRVRRPTVLTDPVGYERAP